jgi:hypothetical protein
MLQGVFILVVLSSLLLLLCLTIAVLWLRLWHRINQVIESIEQPPRQKDDAE